MKTNCKSVKKWERIFKNYYHLFNTLFINDSIGVLSFDNV